MKMYFSYFRLKFKSNLQYRSAALAGVATQVFFGLIFVMVYLAFYESNTGDVPIEKSQLVSYLWLQQILFSLILVWYKDKEIINAIKTGEIAYELARPQKLYFMWYAKILATKLSNVLLRFFPVFLISMLLPSPYNMSMPNSILAFIMFLITISLGSLILVAIITIIHILFFYTINEEGIMGIAIVIADVLTGGVVPIPFLPDFLQKLLNFTPFRYTSDFAFRVYSGNISINSSLEGVVIQIFWIIVLISIGYIITNHATKKVVIQGG